MPGNDALQRALALHQQGQLAEAEKLYRRILTKAPAHFDATTVANGVVYTNDLSGYLIARDAASGVILARFPLGAPSWGGVSPIS